MAEVFTDNWTNPSTGYTAVKVSVTDTGSAARSRIFDLQLNQSSIFRVMKSGELIISNAAGTSLGGIARAGNAGEMGLTSQIHPSTGVPAHIIRYYWEGAVGQVAVIRGMGSNRLSVESAAALVHIAQNGRYEWEGLSAPRLQWIGYEAASAIGRTIDFNNSGQTAYAGTILSVSTVDDSQNLIQFCALSAGNYTELARIDGNGWFYSPYYHAEAASQGQPGFIVQLTGESFARAFLSLDSADRPNLSFGPGNDERDVTIVRSEAGRIQVRGLVQSEFGTLQAKLMTHETAVPGVVVPSHYLILYDAAGNAFKVPCEAL